MGEGDREAVEGARGQNARVTGPRHHAAITLDHRQLQRPARGPADNVAATDDPSTMSKIASREAAPDKVTTGNM